MDTIDLYEKIESYLLGRLPAGEHAAFEAEIQSDPVLAEEVALHRDLIVATGEEDVLALRKKIVEAIAASSVVPQTKSVPEARLRDVMNSDPKTSFPSRWLLILGIVLVVGLMFWFFYQDTNKQKSTPHILQQETQMAIHTPDMLPEQTPDTPREEKYVRMPRLGDITGGMKKSHTPAIAALDQARLEGIDRIMSRSVREVTAALDQARLEEREKEAQRERAKTEKQRAEQQNGLAKQNETEAQRQALLDQQETQHARYIRLMAEAIGYEERGDYLQAVERYKLARTLAFVSTPNTLFIDKAIENCIEQYSKIQAKQNELYEYGLFKSDHIMSGFMAVKLGFGDNLDLCSDNLGALPSRIGETEKLEILRLNDNQLISLPNQIWELKNLTELYLGNNQVNRLPPQIKKLKNLKRLDLTKNQLTSLPPQIRKLKNLTWLNLSGNQLISLPNEIGRLINLTELDLSFNQLTNLPQEIRNLKSLKSLQLGDNPFPPGYIEQLRKDMPWCEIVD